MKQKIEALKRTDLFKLWDADTMPRKALVRYVYDFFYAGDVEEKPDAETTADIIEFLHIIKEGS